MKKLTSLQFVINAIARHCRDCRCSPARVIVSPECYRDMCHDGGAHARMCFVGGVPTVCEVPISEIPGATPRLVRWDGAVEEM